jgi:hypothetical protein
VVLYSTAPKMKDTGFNAAVKSFSFQAAAPSPPLQALHGELRW